MRKIGYLLHLWLITVWLVSSCSQSTDERTKLSVEERLEKARSAKAAKRADTTAGLWTEKEKAKPADYQTPVDKVLRGPNGEVVHTGERGAKYYINKNGNKTYLSSNQ